MSPRPRRAILICANQFDEELKSEAMSVLKLAPIAAKLGVNGVEYRTIYWKDKAKELPAVRQQLGELGLKGLYATFTTLYNSDPQAQARLMQDLEDAHALGSPLLRVFPGVRPGDGPEDAAVREAAQAVIDRAGSYGMRIALENYRAVPGNQLSDIQEELARLNSPVVGTNLDTSNYAMNNQDVVEAIRTLAPHIIYCHFKDAKPTDKGLDQAYIGDGILPMPEIVEALDQAGRDFPLTFEFPGGGDPIGAITRSLAYLATL